MFDLISLPDLYPISPVIEVQEIREGNTSNAKLIKTIDGKYIFRKLKDTNQATTEYIISSVLFEHGISSKILLNRMNQHYIVDKENIYNLQTYLPHDSNKKVNNFYRLGQIISLFHSTTKNLTDIYEQPDRFNLKIMVKELVNRLQYKKFAYKKQLTMMIEQCLKFHHKNNCYIHGDLGSWNLLLKQEQIYIIDFGEVRRGNNHFDISAVLYSTLDWNKEEEVIISSLHDFYNGYITNFNFFNWKILEQNLTLWITRGIVALLINSGTNEQTNKYVSLMLERKYRLERVINTYFL